MKKVLALLLTTVMALNSVACGAKDPKIIYNEASKKTSELASMDVTSDINMNISQSDKTIEMKMNLDMKITDLNTDKMKYLAEGTTTMMGQDMDMTVYYEDGYYYMQSMGQKIKYAMDLDSMIKKIKQSTEGSSMDASYLKGITAEKDGDNQHLTFTVDPEKVNTYVQDLMSQVGTNTEGVTYTVKEASGEAVVGKDGYFSSSKIKMTLDMEIQGEKVSMDMDVKTTYNNPGQTVEITAPDLDGYTEVDPSTLQNQ